MALRKVQMSFTGGELSPAMYGRFDDGKYQQGLAKCRNFICLPQGPVTLRPGTAFVREVKYPDKPTRLIPFTFSSDQTLVIELGDKYARFHTNGQTVMNGNSPYEISTPWAAEDLFELHYVQSMDVMTFVHVNYPPRELRRYGATNWGLSSIGFGAPISAPSSVSASYYVLVPEGTTVTDEEKTRYTLSYCVTAVRVTDTGEEESAASSTGSTSGNLYLNNATVTVSWSSVSGASRYRVYKKYTGLYCYIGETEDTSFVDDNYSPDASITPPRYDSPFGSDYPGAVCYFEQRRCFAGTKNRPQMVWMTRSGTESDMGYTLPSKSDNRLKFAIAAQEASRIRHLVPLNHILALTNTTEYRISSGGTAAMSPDNIDSKVQAQIGASSVMPLVVNSSVVYAAARGGHLREIGYNWQASGYTTGDLSIRAPHFFDFAQIVDMALVKSPDPIVWCAMSDGSLLGFTYLPEQTIGGWHKHEFVNGAVESVTAVQEGDEDILYLIVRRTINGETTRYVERMKERHFSSLENAWHVDCAGEYKGDPVSSVSGLTWLEGQTVSILADGCVLPQRVVTNGKVTLTQESKHVIVGLPITADFQTLPLAVSMEDGSFGTGHMKNVNDVWARVIDSSGVFIGPDFDHLTEVKQRKAEPYGSPPSLMNREVSVMSHAMWNDSGQICIRQKDPLPLTICGIAYDLAS